jgi:hypothetical protein
MLIDNAIMYFTTEFKHSEVSIFRNTAVTNIRNNIYIPGLCSWAVGIKEYFSDVEIKK